MSIELQANTLLVLVFSQDLLKLHFKMVMSQFAYTFFKNFPLIPCAVFWFPPQSCNVFSRKVFLYLMWKYIPFSIELQNLNPNSQKKGLCQWKWVTLNISFTVCTLMSRRKQNVLQSPLLFEQAIAMHGAQWAWSMGCICCTLHCKMRLVKP